jgi:hypothetical protein
MTAGFAAGPLVAGLLAQWLPAPFVVLYLPHVLLTLIVLAALRHTPETVMGEKRCALRLSVPGVRQPCFLKMVVPVAPWVFAAPAVAFALLPNIMEAGHATDGIALVASITTLCALTGVAVQPLARRLDAHSAVNQATTVGLLTLAAGLGLSGLAVQAGRLWLLVPCALVLGGAYGLCVVAGLVEVQRLACEC